MPVPAVAAQAAAVRVAAAVAVVRVAAAVVAARAAAAAAVAVVARVAAPEPQRYGNCGLPFPVTGKASPFVQ